MCLLLTFAGFSLIAATDAGDIVKVGNQGGYEIIFNYFAKVDTATHHSM